MIVGYPSAGSYPYRRNVIGAAPGVRYRRVLDPFLVAAVLGRRLNRLAKHPVFDTNDLQNRFNDFGIWRVDLLHFMNKVSYGRTPWITTFETVVPRFSVTLSCHHGSDPDFSTLRGSPSVRKALAVMSHSSCRRIIAMSQCTGRMQESLLAEFPEFREAVSRKLLVMHPPQDLLVSQFSEKGVDLEGPVRFMMVGNSFFRKGGLEVIETLGHLRVEHGYPIKLVIVSSLIVDSYATKAGPQDVRLVQRSIRDNAEWVEYYPHLPNHEVLELMKKSHVGLMPSYAETYGYSVLEFQAAGCPVITTNVRALPEINDAERGWVIEVPKNRMGEAIYTSPEHRLAISSAVRKGLEQAVHEVLADRSIVPCKAERALAYIAKHHSPSEYGRTMRGVYSEAVHSVE